MKKNIILFIIIIGIIFTYFFHKEKFLIPVSKSEILMDTVVTIKIYGHNKSYLEDILDKCFNKIHNLSTILNNYDNKSEIYKINLFAGFKPVKVSKITLDLISKSKKLCQSTGEFLDISIGALLDVWGFATDSPHLPKKENIKTALNLKGIEHIIINKKDSTVFIDKKGVKIDVGAVAKGYIIDKIVDYLKKIGIEKGVVNAGGDIRFIGFKGKNKFWKVGIRNPLSDKKSDVIKVVKVGNWAIATSGDYERYFIENGQRYHHILNPFTGYPAKKVHSVTVMAENAFLADGLATAIFVMGERFFFEKYYKNFNKLKHFRVIIIQNKKFIDSIEYK